MVLILTIKTCETCIHRKHLNNEESDSLVGKVNKETDINKAIKFANLLQRDTCYITGEMVLSSYYCEKYEENESS